MLGNRRIAPISAGACFVAGLFQRRARPFPRHARKAWTAAILFEKFCRFRHLLVEGLSQHSDAAFDRCRHPEGARVLDVGCGFGDSTLRIAECVGPSGEAVGVDCAENFLRMAEEETRKAGIDNARYFIGDVQWRLAACRGEADD